MVQALKKNMFILHFVMLSRRLGKAKNAKRLHSLRSDFGLLGNLFFSAVLRYSCTFSDTWPPSSPFKSKSMTFQVMKTNTRIITHPDPHIHADIPRILEEIVPGVFATDSLFTEHLGNIKATQTNLNFLFHRAWKLFPHSKSSDKKYINIHNIFAYILAFHVCWRMT